MKRGFLFAVGLLLSVGFGTWRAWGAGEQAPTLCAVSGSSDTLTPSDFAYVGSFKLQDRPGNTSGDPGLGSSWGAITTRTDSGNGLTILVTAWINGSSRVFEYQVPDVGDMTHDLRTTATAPLRRTYSDIFNGLGCDELLAPGNCAGTWTLGLGYVGNAFGNGHELFSVYRQAYYANAWEPTLVSTILNTDESPANGGGYATSTTHGPWCSRSDTGVAAGGRNAYILAPPAGLQSLIPALSGKLLIGGDAFQVGPSIGFGPNMFGFTHPTLNTADTPVSSASAATCSLQRPTTLVSFTTEHPAPRNDNAYLGVSCQNCGCVDASGNTVPCGNLDPTFVRSAAGPPYRGARYLPTWDSVDPNNPGHIPTPLDRLLGAVVIETPGGKSAVLFAAQLVDTLAGYPYPDPLGLGNAMSELWYGQPYTASGAFGTTWSATGPGATTLVGHFIAFSEADVARVASGQVAPHDVNSAWDKRKTELGGYDVTGTGMTILRGASWTRDDFPDLIPQTMRMKIAYDPTSQLLFVSRPSSWKYSNYEIVPTIDVWRVTAR